jgi:hypothetical protein
MTRWWRPCVIAVVALLAAQALAAPFVVFPKAGELVSPDSRYIVRNSDRQGAPADFVGTFHSLWLVESATGRSRKLCDYVGLAAVAWFGNDFLLVTQYLSQKTSRALVFVPTNGLAPVVVDKPTLTSLLPLELRDTLRENDHVFIEASGLEGRTLYLRVWGYGQHDAGGFRWRCQYAREEGTVSCSDSRSANQRPSPGQRRY